MPLFLWNACQLKSGLRGADVDLGGKENHMSFLFQSLSDGFGGRQHSVQFNSTVDTRLESQRKVALLFYYYSLNFQLF